ncbi:hypothetical protein [Streptomyces sp. NPDC005209]|uniref:hypothetical protein n=1 Tax=Streptomyces sp. NPDC005209 TaxID=3156715 RepID=UPI0033A4D1BD
MMYRCGWGTKEGQETVLAVEKHALIRAGELGRATALSPVERPCPMDDDALGHLRA